MIVEFGLVSRRTATSRDVSFNLMRDRKLLFRKGPMPDVPVATRAPVMLSTVIHSIHRLRGQEGGLPGNLELMKSRPDQKIDAAVALMMAIGRATVEDE